jgi:hypothetical protein
MLSESWFICERTEFVEIEFSSVPVGEASELHEEKATQNTIPSTSNLK